MLVANGFMQTYGLDYQETFSLVAKITSVRILISIDTMHQFHFHQLNVKNAFLHYDLKEEVYMLPPPGFVKQGQHGLVCKLKKSIYGLKYSPWAWFNKFNNALLN